jgi:hypothetical protein
MSVCLVCGYPGLTEPPRTPTGAGSDEICPSCGFQFGYHDDSEGITYEKWMTNWTEVGMPWFSWWTGIPAHWDPVQQLENLRLPRERGEADS